MNADGVKPSNGWTLPTILTTLSLINSAGWAWYGISQSSSEKVQNQIAAQATRIDAQAGRLNDQQYKIAVLESRVDDLRERERRQAERGRE